MLKNKIFRVKWPILARILKRNLQPGTLIIQMKSVSVTEAEISEGLSHGTNKKQYPVLTIIEDECSIFQTFLATNQKKNFIRTKF